MSCPILADMTRSEWQNRWMHKRRDAWLKEHGPCEFCGATENLEVDHIDSSDKFTHKIWSYRAEIREAELAKCRVLCRSCHVKRHAKEKIVHGTRSRYEKGCRCEPCMVAYGQHLVRKAYRMRQLRDIEKQALLNKSTS